MYSQRLAVLEQVKELKANMKENGNQVIIRPHLWSSVFAVLYYRFLLGFSVIFFQTCKQTI